MTSSPESATEVLLARTQSPSTAAAASAAQLAWLALALAPGLGSRHILHAVEQVGSPEQILALSLTALESLNFPASAAQAIVEGRARRAAEEEFKKVSKEGAAILTYADESYPGRLKQIFDPPPVLWVRGDAQLLARYSIAVVGTRHPTPYGAGMAEVLSRDLSLRGLIILSGMARGIDTAAHKGALAAGEALLSSALPTTSMLTYISAFSRPSEFST